MRLGSLCTGYGGIELGLQLAGVALDERWHAETNPALAALPSRSPNLGDIREVDWSVVAPIDLLAAGFPCQPVSAAGRQQGQADDRWLWPAVLEAVRALRPDQVLLENVRNLISIQSGALWAGILDDLTGLGYDVRWLTLGACRVGAAHHRHRVFALATLGDNAFAHPGRAERLDVLECGARGPERSLVLPTPSAVRYGSNGGGYEWTVYHQRIKPGRPSLETMATQSMLPTPAARDGDSRGRGEGDAAYWAQRAQDRTNGMPLGAAVALLPTPSARDGTSGPGYAASAEGSPNLRMTVTLLPTPRATDGVNGGPGQRGRKGDLAVPSAVQPEHWGRFAAAVARHEATYGPAPAPTEPNRNGAPRLAPAFAEWLMCLPAGHVTAHLNRRDALAAIGNGVCPPQLAAAWLVLTGALLDMSLGHSVASRTMTSTSVSSPVSAQVAEIQQRQALARERVVQATGSVLAAQAIGAGAVAEIVQSAMMELATVWREESAIFAASSKRGSKSTATELAQAAARLSGFAIGLATPTRADPATDFSAQSPAAPLPTAEPSPCAHNAGALSTRRDGSVFCTDCQNVVGQMPTEAINDALTADNFVPVVETTHHKGDTPVFASPAVPVADTMEIGLPGAPVSASPFVSPAAPGRGGAFRSKVRLGYAELGPIIATTYPSPRPHLSHSFVEDLENCGLKALLRDASKVGAVGPGRPSWAFVGGTAFHRAVEGIEQAALALGGAAPDGELGDWDKYWNEHLDASVDETNLAVAGTLYADPVTWHASNKGMEGYDWWRVQGAIMLDLYRALHNEAWRASHVLLRVPAEPANPNSPAVPVLEFAYASTAGSTALRTEGRIDAAWMAYPGAAGTLSQYPTATLEVIDFKAGRSEPLSTFQQAQYAAILRRDYLPTNFALPIVGRHYLARKGVYTDPIVLDIASTTPEIDYRYTMASRAVNQATFMAHPSSFCSGCAMVDYCPAQAQRDQ